MELLLAGAAIWVSLGMIKGIIWLQQMPEFMAWWAFYRTNQNHDAAQGWYFKPAWLAFAFILGVFSFLALAFIGPFGIFREGMKFFGPYGSVYVSGLAAKWNNIPRGVEPLLFESWEQYQSRVGDDPKRAMNAMVGIPIEQLPEKVKDVIKVASSLRDLQDRNVPEVDEEDEFKKEDKDE